MNHLYDYAFEPANAPFYVTFISLEAAGVVCVAALLFRAWRQVRDALPHRYNAAVLALLPAHVSFLKVFTGTSLLQAVMSVTTDPFFSALGALSYPELLAGVAIACNDALLHGQALFMLQRVAGEITVCRTLGLGCLAGLATLLVYVVAFLMDLGNQPSNLRGASILLLASWQLLLALSYGFVWLCPMRYLSRRRAVVAYARFWFWCRLLLSMSLFGFYVYVVYLHFDETVLVISNIIMTIAKGFLYSCVGPFTMYWAMLQDSEFWQGWHPMPNSPFQDNQLSADEAEVVARVVEALPRNIRFLDDVHISQDKLLGQGGEAKVFAGEWQGQPVAVKVLFTMRMTNEAVQGFCNEAAILAELQHDNVLAVHGICVVPPILGQVMQLCEKGSLHTVLSESNRSPLSWLRALRLCQDCAKAVKYLHSIPILHRDIKGGNFLVDAQDNVRIADFGIAIRLAAQQSQHSRSRRNLTGSCCCSHHDPGGGPSTDVEMVVMEQRPFVGTEEYAAPEVLRGEEYSPAADVYSLGVVLYEIATQTAEGRGTISSEQDLSDAIARSHSHTDSVSVARLASLIRRCWAKQPCDRPDAHTIVATLQRLMGEATNPANYRVHDGFLLMEDWL